MYYCVAVDVWKMYAGYSCSMLLIIVVVVVVVIVTAVLQCGW